MEVEEMSMDDPRSIAIYNSLLKSIYDRDHIEENPDVQTLNVIISKLPKSNTRCSYKYERIPGMYYGLLQLKHKDNSIEYVILDEAKVPIPDYREALIWCAQHTPKEDLNSPVVDVLSKLLQKYFSRGLNLS